MFTRRIRLFRLLGFDVRVDASWLIIATLVTWSLAEGFFPHHYPGLTSGVYWLMGIAGALGLFGSIIIHELSHSIVARRYGMPIDGITLFIFGGVAEMRGEPPNPGAEFRMAVAGPLASALLGIACYAANIVAQAAAMDLPVIAVLNYLALINLLLAAFNLVPAFPLDGGRMLRAALWHWKGDIRRATRMSSRMGSGFGIVLIVLGLLQFMSMNFIAGMWYVLIGMFIRFAAEASYRQLVFRQYLHGEPVRRFMTDRPDTVSSRMTLHEVVEDHLYRRHHKMFPVVDGDRLLGLVTWRQIQAVPRERWEACTVAEVMTGCSETNTIAPDADATDALALMQRTGSSRLLVARGQRLEGVLSLKDLMEFFSLKIDLESRG
jgi:Zn-dependent protease